MKSLIPQRTDRAALGTWVLAYLAAAWFSIVVIRVIPHAGDWPDYLTRWNQWDADRFWWLATYGYDGGPPGRYEDYSWPAFFPGYPLAIRLVGLIVTDYRAAGLFISFLAGPLAALALSRLTDLSRPSSLFSTPTRSPRPTRPRNSPQAPEGAHDPLTHRPSEPALPFQKPVALQPSHTPEAHPFLTRTPPAEQTTGRKPVSHPLRSPHTAPLPSEAPTQPPGTSEATTTPSTNPDPEQPTAPKTTPEDTPTLEDALPAERESLPSKDLSPDEGPLARQDSSGSGFPNGESSRAEEGFSAGQSSSAGSSPNMGSLQGTGAAPGTESSSSAGSSQGAKSLRNGEEPLVEREVLAEAAAWVERGAAVERGSRAGTERRSGTGRWPGKGARMRGAASDGSTGVSEPAWRRASERDVGTTVLERSDPEFRSQSGSGSGSGAGSAVEGGKKDERKGPGPGFYAVLALVTSPCAVFLFAAYSEALFLALAIPAWLLAKKGRWELAVLCAAGASVVRITGLFLALGLIVEFLVGENGRKAPGGWRNAPYLVTPFLSIGAYMGYQWYRTGDPLAWQHAQEQGWNRHTVWPWEAFETTWYNAFTIQTEWSNSFRVEIFAAIVGVLLVLWLLYRRQWPETVYISTQLAAFMTSSFYLSIGRATLLWFPLWILLGHLMSRHRWFTGLYLALSLPLAAAFVASFTQGQWTG
ncbi:hypothetical protein [Actinocorallia populi]|uniref:hypothetical protein n=1 Tax=Actinocorallia populi TaxID=2079200 RepID=UPI00130099BB|nr:hypothetical protein [Actinocorallia populi]